MVQLRHAILAGLLLGMAGSANAATQIFSGVDDGAVPGGNTPNSSIAQAAFLAAAAAKGPVFTNYLDGEPLGNLQSYHIAGGLQVNLSVGSHDPQNTAHGIRNESANGDPNLPFSTTEGPGDEGKWLGIPIYLTTFTFDVPTHSFGFYTTGLNIDAGAYYSLIFDDAPAVPENIYYMPVNANGGISYWGVVFDTPVHKVEFNRSRNQGLDVFGIDGISFNVAPAPPPPPVGDVPEPASWAMLIAGFGLVGTAMRRRRTVLLV